MSDQNCITCYWGNRDEIDDEMYSIIKQLGLRFRGNGNWIYFKTFEKKSFPSLPNYGEIKMLIETYKGLIETLKHEDYQESIFAGGDILYTQKMKMEIGSLILYLGLWNQNVIIRFLSMIQI